MIDKYIVYQTTTTTAAFDADAYIGINKIVVGYQMLFIPPSVLLPTTKPPCAW